MSAGSILRCWLALMLLLALTTGARVRAAGRRQPRRFAGDRPAKALIVLVMFMELKGSSGLVRTFAAAGFFWLLIMIALTTADYAHRTDQRVPSTTPTLLLILAKCRCSRIGWFLPAAASGPTSACRAALFELSCSGR